MAKLSVNGIDSVIYGAAFITPPDDVKVEILEAQAEVVERVQKEKAKVHKVEDTGLTLESIRHGKPWTTKDGKAMHVYPQGTRKRGDKTIRNGEIAFLNEYGQPKRGIAARPFIREANEACADEAVQKAYKVYDDYLNKKGL